MVIMDENLKQNIINDATQKYPQECCGILFGNCDNGCRNVFEVRSVKNSENQNHARTHFEISAREMMTAERYAANNNFEIVGVYHSHPDCGDFASSEDNKYAVPDLSYVIVSVVNGKYGNMSSWVKPKENYIRELEAEKILLKRDGKNGSKSIYIDNSAVIYKP